MVLTVTMNTDMWVGVKTFKYVYVCVCVCENFQFQKLSSVTLSRQS